MTWTIKCNDKQQLFHTAAQVLRDAITEIHETKKYVTLALPGGKSIQGFLQELKETDIPWNDIHIFMVDERLVPFTDKESNFQTVKKGLLDDLIKKQRIPPENIHPFQLQGDAPDYGISTYITELTRYGTGYDIIILGAGEDSHVGSLFPNHPSIKHPAPFFLPVLDAPKNPPRRMTLSREHIVRAKITMIFFLDPIKKRAYQLFQDPCMEYQQCPSKLILSVKKSYVFTNL